jgi:WD40 repeat protein
MLFPHFSSQDEDSSYQTHHQAMQSHTTTTMHLVSASRDRTIRIWDPTSGDSVHTLRGHHAAVKVVKVSNNAQFLASGGEDKQVILWNMEEKSILWNASHHNGFIQSLDFNATDTYLLSTSGGICLVSEVRTGERIFERSERMLTSLFSNMISDRVIALLSTGVFKVWDIDSAATAAVQFDAISALSLSPTCFNQNHLGTRLVAGTSTGFIVILESSSFQQVLLAPTIHLGLVVAITFNADSTQIASCGLNKVLVICDASTGNNLFTINVGNIVQSLAFSSNSQFLAAGLSSREIFLMNIDNNMDEVTRLKGHFNCVYGVCFSPCSNILM